MKAFGLFLLLLIMWWSTQILLFSGGRIFEKDFGLAVAFTLFFGSFYAVPSAAYVTCANAYSRTFSFPKNVAVFLLLVLCGFAALFAVEVFWLGRRLPTTEQGWYDYGLLRLSPHFVIVAIVLIRQFTRPKHLTSP